MQPQSFRSNKIYKYLKHQSCADHAGDGFRSNKIYKYLKLETDIEETVIVLEVIKFTSISNLK